jgi:hypothetical protein
MDIRSSSNSGEVVLFLEMKKNLFFILIALVFSINASGQLKGGLKGGLNLADMVITDGANYFGESTFNTKASYHFGTYVKNNFSKNFGFQVEMLFSNKGYTLESDSLSSTVSLNYLNWPILLLYELGEKVDFNAGLELGLLVTGEDIYRDFDIGIDVGVEYDISRKLLLGLRYNQGLPFKMNIDSFEFTGAEPKYQHNVIQFYIGFNIVSEPAENIE